MKTLGLIGGTSWASTVDYYRIINQRINEKLGGVNSSKIFMYSLNLAELNALLEKNDWKGIAGLFCGIARKLEQAGAECIVICANTPHKAADDVQKAVKIPLIHIAEVTAKEIGKAGLKKVGLLGTKITMEESFFKDRLAKRGVETVIPENENDRLFIHKSIFNELGKGIFSKETKEKYLGIIDQLVSRGAKGIIFGCTEIPLLLKPEDCPVPVFDTTLIHATAAVEFALGDSAA